MLSGRDALAELRAQLAQDFPAFDPAALRKILKRHRLSSPPAGLLLDDLPRGAGDELAHTGDHPLFSPGYYLAAHPDVAAAGVPAWLHYQVFGRVEGRTPHPFVDIALLREALPDTAPGEELDRYLGDRSTWFAEPGPYTETVRYALSGLWSKDEAPLAEIVRSHADGPWLHHSLMVVDLAGSPVAARLAAFSSVLGAAPAGVRTPTLSVWSDGEAPAGGAYVVVPGFFAGTAGTRIWTNPATATSPDRTAVATPSEVVTITAGPRITGTTLVFFVAHAARDELETAVRIAEDGTVFAPYSRADEVSLRQLAGAGAVVLDHGRQATVDAARIELRDAAPAAAVPAAPDDLTADAVRSVIVLPAEQRDRTTDDTRVRDALASGAALCLIDAHGLESWLPLIQNRDRVIAGRGMAEAVAALVPADRILDLDGGSR